MLIVPILQVPRPMVHTPQVHKIKALVTMCAIAPIFTFDLEENFFNPPCLFPTERLSIRPFNIYNETKQTPWTTSLLINAV